MLAAGFAELDSGKLAFGYNQGRWDTWTERHVRTRRKCPSLQKLHPKSPKLYSIANVMWAVPLQRRISCRCDPPIQIGMKVYRKWELMNPGPRTVTLRTLDRLVV